MIAKLRGIVDSVGEDWVVLDVQGVGYLVACATRTLSRLPGPGEAASLLIETQMREDAIFLYGFASAGERDWFRLLTTVQGVGARVALALLSVLAPDDLVSAIASGDKASLTRASGVGPKLAQRILNELKDRVGALAGGGVLATAEAGGAAATGAANDAISALVNLGYRRADAFGAVSEAVRKLGPEAGIDSLIRAGLKELAP